MATKEKEQLDESGVPFEIPKGVRRQFARRGKIYWMGSVVKKNRKWGGDKRYCVITRTGVYLVKSGKLSRCILHSQIDTLVDLIAAEDEKLVAVKTREGLHDFVVEVGLDVNQKVRKDEFENSLKEAYFASTHTHLRSVELSEASGEKKTEFLNLKPAPYVTIYPLPSSPTTPPTENGKTTTQQAFSPTPTKRYPATLDLHRTSLLALVAAPSHHLTKMRTNVQTGSTWNARTNSTKTGTSSNTHSTPRLAAPLRRS